MNCDTTPPSELSYFHIKHNPKNKIVPIHSGQLVPECSYSIVILIGYTFAFFSVSDGSSSAHAVSSRSNWNLGDQGAVGARSRAFQGRVERKEVMGSKAV
jgi:hypothetical protein